MKALSSLRSVDAVFISRLLRKNAIDKIVLGAKVLLGFVALFFIAQLVQEILSTRAKLSSADLALRNREVVPTKASNKIAPPGGRDYSIIVRESLVGAIESPNAKATPPPQKPVSTIPMGLIGVFIQDKKDPYAIIEDKKKNLQDVFMIDEMIFGEAKLKKILSDRVEIERNGVIEQLILEDLPSKGGGDVKGGISTDGNTFTIEEAELDKALESLALLLTQARAVPYFKDGVAIGLRLFAIKSDSIFEKLGLKNGDILKTVNGNNLGDLTQAMKLFETLKQERSLSVHLERSLQEQEFKYEIR